MQFNYLVSLTVIASFVLFDLSRADGDVNLRKKRQAGGYPGGLLVIDETKDDQIHVRMPSGPMTIDDAAWPFVISADGRKEPLLLWQGDDLEDSDEDTTDPAPIPGSTESYSHVDKALIVTITLACIVIAAAMSVICVIGF